MALSTDDLDKNPSQSSEGNDLLSQEDLDRLLAEFNESPSDAPQDSAISLDDLTRGDRPEIIKESLDDPAIVRALMGTFFREEMLHTSDDDTTGLCKALTQDELDELIASQLARQETEDERIVDASQFQGERPVIEREEIEDKSIEKLLLTGTVTPKDSATDDGPFSQEEIDALIREAELREATRDESPVDKESSPKKLESKDDEFIAVEKDLGLLSQADLDALMSGGGSEKDSADDDSSATSQDDIDALIAATASEAAESPVEASGASSQDDIDALIAATASEEAEAPADASGASSQDDIDALIAATASEAAESPADDSGISSQDDIDALIAATTSEEPEATKADDAFADVAEDLGVLNQADLDALIAATTSEEPEATKTDDAFADVAEDLGILNQDDLDALLAGAAGEDASADAELESMGTGDAESLLAEGTAQDVLDNRDMEERLDGVTDESPMEPSAGEVSQDNIDALLAGASVVEDDSASEEASEISQDDIDALLSGTVTESEEIVEQEADEEPASEEVLAEVGGENIAAGAAPDDVGGTVEVTPEPVVIAEEAIPVAEVTDSEEDAQIEETVEGKESLLQNALKVPGVAVQFVGQDPWRAITGIAAGLIVAMSSYLYMSANEFQQVEDYRPILMTQESDLERAITVAEYLIEEEDYFEASTVIERALLKGNPKSPVFVDAEYVKLEADLKGLPKSLSEGETDYLHSDIDRVMMKMPLHPKRTDALFWKGQLYESEGNLQAARVEYRELLRHEPQADNRHEVLLALGELEMETDRPIEAAKYLQELRVKFPGTHEALQARLLIADAYAAVGDIPSARATYISIAETHPNDKIGADAFARLGELAYESGDYDQAIRELEGRLKTARTIEGNDGVTLLLAKAYRASGRTEDAKNMLNSLIDFFPISEITPLARIEMSLVLEELGLGREAVRYATHAVQLFPGHPGVLRNAGEFLAKNGNSLDAARALVAAESAGADDPELLLAAGRLFVKAGAVEDGKVVFEQLLTNYAKTPQGIMGNIELAKMEYAGGMPSDAIDRLEELRLVMRTSSEQVPILTALGEFYSDLGMMAKIADTYGEIAVLTNEPELLAHSTIALLRAGVTEDGLTISDNVEVQQLSDATAYAFLNTKGRSLLQIDAKEGLGYLEQAHAGYVAERTAMGVQQLLEANLTMDRSARARALVAELGAYVAQREHYEERPRLERAAATWGNYLYDRQDYRAAANAYEMALDAQLLGRANDDTLSETQTWSLFQRANALYRLSDYETCIPLYERVSASASQWGPEAKAKLASAQLEQRMRGITVPETRNAG